MSNACSFIYHDYNTTQISFLGGIYTGKTLEKIVLYDIYAKSFSVFDKVFGFKTLCRRKPWPCLPKVDLTCVDIKLLLLLRTYFTYTPGFNGLDQYQTKIALSSHPNVNP